MSSHSHRFPALHLEIFTDRRAKTPYHYGLFRSSFREDGKVKHRTYGRVTGLPLAALKTLREFVRRGCRAGDGEGPLNNLTNDGPVSSPAKDGAASHAIQDGPAGCRIKDRRELGACRAVLALVEELGIPRMIYSRREPWVRRILAMIVGRVVYQGSKLGLVNLWKDSALWELCGLGTDRPDVDECYEALDHLLSRRKSIHKQLAQRHLKDGCLVMYDTSSSYMEGAYKASQLVAFGHNRDGKRGHRQINYGLMTNGDGCPVGLAVYAGNTADQTTVKDRVKELKADHGIQEVVFAGDRGMLTPPRLSELKAAGLRTLTALTHPLMQALVERKVIQPGLFDERAIGEVCDPEQASVRYLLCRNPLTAEKEARTRAALIAKTRQALETLAASRKNRTAEQIGAAVGVALKKWRVGKFFNWKVEAGKPLTSDGDGKVASTTSDVDVNGKPLTLDNGKPLTSDNRKPLTSDKNKLVWSQDDARIAEEAALDGCYVVRTDASAARLDKDQAVAAYRNLAAVDRGFRQLKTVSLEVRPVYHKKDPRIEAHLFVCFLAYYVQWHMQRRLAPLFAADGIGKDRRWTFAHVIERLKSISRATVVIHDADVQLDDEPSADQQSIIDLLAGKPDACQPDASQPDDRPSDTRPPDTRPPDTRKPNTREP